MTAGYAYIWEYRVRPETVGEFERMYGPEGAWVLLYWRSADDWKAFRKASGSEFEALNKRGDALTYEETFLGEFAPPR